MTNVTDGIIDDPCDRRFLKLEKSIIIMRIAAIVTARNTSRRLPGKATVDIGGKPALAHLLERLKTVPGLQEIVVATTANPEDRPIHALAAAAGVKSFAGSEHDVLARLAGAARSVAADVVVYCTGDCTFLAPEIVAQAIALQQSTRADFVSNCIPRSYVGGMDVEILTRQVLERLDAELNDPWDREHVTEHVYLRPLRYKASYFQAPEGLRYPHLQVCLDTSEDLELLRSMHTDLTGKGGTPLFGAQAIVDWLSAHPRQASGNQTTRKRSYAVGLAGLGKVSWNPEATAPDFWTHIEAIKHVPDLILSGAADADQERLARFKSLHRNVATFANVDEMLKNQELDIVYICTPTDLHLAALKSALVYSSAPLVMCEKPLSDRLDGVREVVDSYRKHGRRLLVNYWTRWSDAHAALKAALPELGAIQSIHRTYSLGLFNSGSYAIDQLRDMFGEISGVQAVSGLSTSRSGDDGVSAIVHFRAAIPPANLIALDGRDHVTTDMDIIGARGRARLTENDTRLDIYTADPKLRALKLARSARFDDMTPFLGLAQSIVGALRFGREPPAAATDALRALEICEAIRRSHAGGNNHVTV